MIQCSSVEKAYTTVIVCNLCDSILRYFRTTIHAGATFISNCILYYINKKLDRKQDNMASITKQRTIIV